MNKETELALKMIDILSKQNATPEEKKVQALIKTALFSDSLMNFISEVKTAFNGFGKVRSDTVKRVVDYFKAQHEVQIRNTSFSDEEKDKMVEKESNRLMEVAVIILGSLEYWGLLA